MMGIDIKDLKDYGPRYALLTIPVVLIGLLITLGRRRIPKILER